MKRILLALVMICGLAYGSNSFIADIKWSVQTQTDWDIVETAELGNYNIIMGSREGISSVPRYEYNHSTGRYEYIGTDNYPYNDDGLEICDSSGNIIDVYDFPDGAGNITFLTALSESTFLVSFNGVYLCTISNEVLNVTALSVESLPITVNGKISSNIKDGIAVMNNGYLTMISVSNIQQSVTAVGEVSSGFSQDNFVLNWDSSSGTEYQIQSSTDLTNWINVGSSIVGTGETMTWANHVTNSQAFYRVVED